MNRVCEPLGGDGSTCIPGCSPVGEQCQEIGHDWSCSFGGADMLRAALQAQQDREGYRARNNEIVLEGASVFAHLPASIEGIFYMVGADTARQLKAREVHTAFLEAYGLRSDDAAAPLLLQLDLSPGISQPFSLA